MRKRMRIIGLVVSFTVCAIIGARFGFVAGVQAEGARPVEEDVMTIGGSVAHGWKDSESDGYLARAFHTMDVKTHSLYFIDDRTIEGANGTQVATRYTKWLQGINPQITVLSWGLLNDALPKTPVATFDAQIHSEIAQALADHSVVLMVTPPVTRATYTEYKVQEEMYADAEMKVARSFKSPNVYVFDVMHQMESYLVAHHQTYVPYMADGWHPNTKGHILAGEILAQDMLSTFHGKPVTFAIPQ